MKTLHQWALGIHLTHLQRQSLNTDDINDEYIHIDILFIQLIEIYLVQEFGDEMRITDVSNHDIE